MTDAETDEITVALDRLVEGLDRMSAKADQWHREDHEELNSAE